MNLLAGDFTLLFSVSALSFFVPLALGHLSDFPNQLIVGTIVNALLAYSALRFSFARALPVILLPALGALASGILFGELSVFLVYLVPFIWFGNAAFVFLVKRMFGGIGFAATIGVSSIAKALVIGASATALFLLGLVPAALLAPMSIIQLVTALVGGAIGAKAAGK